MLEQKTIRQLATMLNQGDVTSAALVTYYFERIQTYDQHFHSILLVNQEAKALAAQLDQERKKTRAAFDLAWHPFYRKRQYRCERYADNGRVALIEKSYSKE
ncbi:hypothetical protein JCM19055_3917 [Geomicrobium sp. JCM 19055]|nr:hypothetical protein [Geomicrobium sp. JCM 19055]GAK00802.1 hypothetical protein JCM19055_3917 [Geomicrobium sp. JCM 19055]